MLPPTLQSGDQVFKGSIHRNLQNRDQATSQFKREEITQTFLRVNKVMLLQPLGDVQQRSGQNTNSQKGPILKNIKCLFCKTR